MKIITNDPVMKCDECDAQVDWLLEIGQSYLCADCLKKTYDMAWAQWLEHFVKGVGGAWNWQSRHGSGAILGKTGRTGSCAAEVEEMTKEQIATLFNRRAELKIIETSAQERLSYVNAEKVKNNLTCDHKHADGRWAESEENGICGICGCGMGYQHYLETK